MKRKWVFMDETGVLSKDPAQPFFALGMLKVEQTAALYAELNRLAQVARSKVDPRFEFKFNQIKNTNKDFYIELVDLFFRFPDLYFKAFVVDKQHPRFDPGRFFSGTWDAQIGYARLLLRNTVFADEQAAVVADYLDRPKSSPLFFETEVLRLARPPSHRGVAEPLIYNVCMLESHASLFIQLVDVLLGLVVYDCKAKRGVGGTNAAKQAVLGVLKKHLGVTDLCQTLDVTKPPYFGVWYFSPK